MCTLTQHPAFVDEGGNAETQFFQSSAQLYFCVKCLAEFNMCLMLKQCRAVVLNLFSITPPQSNFPLAHAPPSNKL